MSKFTVFPKRELILVVQHPAIGDYKFCSRVNEALRQMIDETVGCDVDSFTAHNGVTIDVLSVPMLVPEDVTEGDDPGSKADRPEITDDLPDPLKLGYQAVLDTEDSLDAIQQAIQDGDYSSALTLINTSRESLQEHVETLRDLL